VYGKCFLSLHIVHVMYEAHYDRRSEAWAIPQLLVGSTTHSHLDREHDQHVLFREGTCLAVDDPHSIRLHNYDSEEESIAIDPEDRFYELLLKRFYQLRSTLANIAKEKDSRRIPNTQTASDKTYLQTRSEHTWSDSIGQAHPTADQVVQLGSAIVYARLQCCANTLDHATSLSPKTSSWIWSLLASIGDVGTLDNEKISRVRDLALKAGLMSHRLRKASTGDEVSSIRVGVDAKKTHIPEASTCEQGFPGDAGDVGDMNSAPEDSKSLQDSTLLYKNGNVEGSKTPLGPALGQHNSQYARASPTSESESGAEMSVSGDEEQVYALQASDPDQARARLLLQLGDRLVHAQPLPSAISSRTAPEDQYLCDPEQHMAKPLPVQNSSGSTTQVDENDHGSKGVAGRKLDGSAGNGVDQNTQVTIDMILTVAAECFGQKDLLKYRNRW
jgi:hypothetical protein